MWSQEAQSKKHHRPDGSRPARPHLQVKSAVKDAKPPSRNGPEGPFLISADHQASGRHTLGRLRVLLDGVEVHGLVDIGRIRVDDAHGLLVLGHGDLALDDV